MNAAHDQPRTLKARWLFPVQGPPLAGATITVSGARILSVDPCGARSPDRDLGNVAIIPGLVNAHTHLDLTGMRGKVAPGKDFTAWLRAVIGQRRLQTLEQTYAAIDQGLSEALHHGTTLLGDISAAGVSWQALATAFPGRAVVFYELLGLPRSRAADAWRSAARWLGEHVSNDHCRPGLSPHAPYSVRKSLFRIAARRARSAGLPVAIHLAETPAELELLEHRRGPFVNFLEAVGVWDPRGLVPDIAEVSRLNQDVPHFLIAHGNYLSPFAVPGNATVVYCPRTHAAFAHSPYPLREFLAAGVRIALGTDSLASNPDLDLLAEARFVHEMFPDIPGDTVLRMATLAGAEALGWADQTGSLTAGKSADLIAIPLPEDEAGDPYELLWRSPPRPRAVMARGQFVDLLKLPRPSHT